MREIPGFSDDENAITRLNAKEIEEMEYFDSMLSLVGGKYPIIDKFTLYGICDINSPQNVFFKGRDGLPRFLDLNCATFSNLEEPIIKAVLPYIMPWEIAAKGPEGKEALKALVMSKLKDPKVLEAVNEALAPLREYIQTTEYQEIRQFMIDTMSLVYGSDSYIVKRHKEEFELTEAALRTQQYPESFLSGYESPNVFVGDESILIANLNTLVQDLPKVIRDNIIKEERDGDSVSIWIPKDEGFLDLIPSCEFSHLLPLTEKGLDALKQRSRDVLSQEEVSTQALKSDLEPQAKPKDPKVEQVFRRKAAHDRNAGL